MMAHAGVRIQAFVLTRVMVTPWPVKDLTQVIAQIPVMAISLLVLDLHHLIAAIVVMAILMHAGGRTPRTVAIRAMRINDHARVPVLVIVRIAPIAKPWPARLAFQSPVSDFILIGRV
jgi:hypothetical protein